MNTAAHFNLQLQSLQLTILIIQVFLMGIGGFVFGLGVAMRPILRITKHEHFYQVRSILDLFISIGLWQIVTAGFNCLAACWKLIWPLYLAMGMTLIVIILEISAMTASFYLLTHISELVNEEIYRAWFKFECKHAGSCKVAMANYIHHFMMPQATLATLAVILQCVAIMYLSRCIRSLNAKQIQIWKSREDLLNNVSLVSHHSFVDSMDGILKRKTDNLNDHVVQTPQSATQSFCSYDPNNPMSNVAENEENVAKYNTPNSILKGDHGYVLASNSSLNFDDSYAQQSQSNQKGTPSISFNTSVQVHYFESNGPVGDEVEGKEITTAEID